MLRIVHVEWQTERPEELVSFYENVFGWRAANPEGIDDYWHITTGAQTDKGINASVAAGGASAVVPTIEVPSVNEYVELIKRNGGRAVGPVQTLPDGAEFAYCEDPQGSRIGLIARPHR